MKNLIITLLVLLQSLPSLAIIGPIAGPNVVCQGSTLTLTDPTTGGIWTSSNISIATIGSTTGIVTGIAGGTAIVTYTIGTAFAIKNVTVNPTPPLFAVYGYSGHSDSIAICVEDIDILVDSVTGGYWTSQSPSIAGIDSVSGILSGISPGTTTVEYTLGSGCGVARPVTVVRIPGLIVSPNSVCVGSVIGVSDTTPSGSWSVGWEGIHGLASVSGSGVVTGLSPGPVVIYYELAGCVSEKLLIVNPNPGPINGPPSICLGSAIVFTDSVSGGIWSSASTRVSVADSGLVSVIAAGPAVISYTLSTGCSATFSVNVSSVFCTGTPTGGAAYSSNPTVCYGTPATISLSGATSSCNIIYQWQNSADGVTFTNIAEATNYSYSFAALNSMQYRCKVTCTGSGLFAYSTIAPVIVHSTILTHSVTNNVDTICNNLDFYVSACGISASFNVTTWFGDGTSVNTPLSASGICDAHLFHHYNTPGTYLVTHVLFAGTIPQDTIRFSYQYISCSTLPVSLYFDANNDCLLDDGEKELQLPVRVEVDSNSVPIDTISATSGFYYKAYGPPGAIYAFKVISSPGSIHASCPASGVVYDTIQNTVNGYITEYVGFNCGTSGSAYDLAEHVTVTTGRHMQTGTIIVDNTFCIPEDAIVTLHFSPKYDFSSSSPAPSAVSGNTATWNLSAVSSASPSPNPIINFTLRVPDEFDYSTWLHTGDTAHSSYLTFGTSSGDVDTSNNVIGKNDTVRASYDPNEMSVSPQSKILPCEQLQYTIRFENDGNDTARNIYILDTLSDYLDPRSINIEIASSVMKVAVVKDGIHNIIKFDLPAINLPDSTHHNQCEGVVIFSIKSRFGLPDGVDIRNNAGIFFDDNPAVTTNTVETTIGTNPISGPSSVCFGSGIALSDAVIGGVWSSGSPALAGIGSVSALVTGVGTGTANISYSYGNSCVSKVVVKTITVNPTPPVITGPNSVCKGSTSFLNDTGAGIWSSSDVAVASIGSGSGVIAGITADTVIIIYTVGTGCKTEKVVSVNPLPLPISGIPAICNGTTSTFTDSGSGIWTSYNTFIATVDSVSGLVAGLSAGTSTIKFTLNTGCSAIIHVTIDPLPFSYALTGGGSYCAGGTGVGLSLTGSAAGVNYQLMLAGLPFGAPFAGTGFFMNLGTTYTSAGTYTMVATNTTSGCTNNTLGSATVSINPLPNAFSVAGGGGYCTGGSGIAIRLSGSTVGVSYQLFRGAISVGAAVAGTGGVLTFGLQTVVGTYTVQATNTTTFCQNTMTGSATVSINPLPGAFTVTGGGGYCAGGAGLHVGLNGTAVGISYQLFVGASPAGSAIAGTGFAIDFGLQTTAGIYTVQATNTTTLCQANMTGSITIMINPLPTAFTVTGGGSYCAGGAGVPMGISSSQTGTNYTLHLGSLVVDSLSAGTGAPLSFGLQTIPGEYFVVATNNSTLCIERMPDSVQVAIIPSVTPSVSVTKDAPDTVCNGTLVTFDAICVYGGATPLYQWKVNGINVGSGLTYSYTPSDSDMVTAHLTSSANCAIPDTVSSSVRMNVGGRLAPLVSITSDPPTDILPGENVTFTASILNGGDSSTFQWVVTLSYVAGATNATYSTNTISNNDTVVCIITTLNECGRVIAAQAMVVPVNNTGIISVSHAGTIAVFPNPNKGYFSIIGSTGSPFDEIDAVEVSDMLGHVVYKGQTTELNGKLDEHVSLNNSLANGMFILTLRSGNDIKMFHFTVNK